MKKSKKPMTWAQNKNYHAKMAERANRRPDISDETFLYHVMCFNRADQHLNGMKNHTRDLRKRTSKSLWLEAEKKIRG